MATPFPAKISDRQTPHYVAMISHGQAAKEHGPDEFK
jgi:hypothetical protein